jgi:transposase InsO family protein
VVELLVTMAGSNPTWGYTRLRGALRHLGHEIGRNTIKRILQDHGIVPAPERGKQTTWKTFIKAHLGQMAEADFFTVEALTWWGPVRYFVFFIIDIETRRVEIANVSHQPHQELMNQIARNLVDDEEGVLREKRYLLCDRDHLYTESFRSILDSGGVEVLRMPARSPNLRPYSERFVRTIKEECLSRVVPLGEKHLRHCITGFVRHYHAERPHQGLGNELIDPEEGRGGAVGAVACRQRLGGMLHYYYREAA